MAKMELSGSIIDAKYFGHWATSFGVQSQCSKCSCTGTCVRIWATL